MLTVHHLNNSRSQRILWLLEELGTGYAVKHYTRNKTTNLAPPELRQVHPLGKSPVITDADGTVVFESGAIVDYIARKYGSKSPLLPKSGTREHEVYLMWLHYSEGSAIFPLLLQMFVSRIGKDTAIQPAINEATALHMGYIENALKNQEYLMGSGITAADIQMSFVGEWVAASKALAPKYVCLALALLSLSLLLFSSCSKTHTCSPPSAAG